MLKPQEIKKLLKNKKTLQVYVTNLDKAIEYERSKPQDEIITALSLTQNISGMPFPPAGSVSNKTADIAQSYIDTAKKELQAMEQESRLIKNTLEQLDIAVNSLDSISKEIITKHYFDKVKCRDLVTVFGDAMEQRNERTISRNINKSLLKLAMLVTISAADYYYISSHERLNN